MSVEQSLIDGINAMEKMALANYELLRSVKGLIPEPFGVLVEPAIEINQRSVKAVASGERKVVRKASAYSKRYGKAFKKVAPRFKKKAGGWKKNGFKNAQKAAHKLARK